MTCGHALTGLLAGPSRHEIADDTVAPEPPANPAGDRIRRAAVSRADASPFAAALRSLRTSASRPVSAAG